MRNGFHALVVGASGGIGSALVDHLRADPRAAHVSTLSRRDDGLELTDEATIEAAAERLAATAVTTYGPLHLVIDATGALEADGTPPERSWKRLDPAAMHAAFAVNAVGPALLFKHLHPLLAPEPGVVFATLSARIGSIGDNRLGGWMSYRVAKAALNQVVRCASIELGRRIPGSIVLALHPGTIETALTRPYARGRYTHTAAECASNLMAVIDARTADDTGSFWAYDGSPIPW